MKPGYWVKFLQLRKSGRISRLFPEGEGYLMAPKDTLPGLEFINASWISYEKFENLVDVLLGVEEMQEEMIVQRKPMGQAVCEYMERMEA